MRTSDRNIWRKWQLDLDGVLGAMGVVVYVDQAVRNLAQGPRGVRVYRDVAERRVEGAHFPQRHAAFGCGDAGMVGREDDDEAGNSDAGKYGGGGWAGVDVTSVRDDNTDGLTVRRPDGPSASASKVATVARSSAGSEG